MNVLPFLAKLGVAFVLIRELSKAPVKRKWTAHPEVLETAQAHAESGGNIGILGGYGKIVLLDIDDRYPEFAERFPKLAETLTVTHPDAPNKAKLILRMTDEVPPSTRDPETNIELLGYGRQGVVFGTHPNGASYELINTDKPLAKLTLDDLEQVWFEWTGKKIGKTLPEAPRASEQAKDRETPTNSHKNGSQRFLEAVRAAWPTCWEVLEHHGITGETKVEGQGGRNTRILGYGGLLIKTEEPQFFTCFADGISGDVIDCWGWCKYGGSWNRHDKELFYGVLLDMATEAGIDPDDPVGIHRKIGNFKRHLQTLNWKGTGGKSDLKGIIVLINLVETFGTNTITISTYQLAEKANMGNGTASRVLRRLENERGLIKRVTASDGLHAPTYELQLEVNENTEALETTDTGEAHTTGVDECSTFFEVLSEFCGDDLAAWGAKIRDDDSELALSQEEVQSARELFATEIDGGLGTSAPAILAELERARNQNLLLGLPEIATAAQVSEPTARRILRSLVFYKAGEVIQDGRRKFYRLFDDWRVRLEMIRPRLTTFGRGIKQAIENSKRRIKRLGVILRHIPEGLTEKRVMVEAMRARVEAVLTDLEQRRSEERPPGGYYRWFERRKLPLAGERWLHREVTAFFEMVDQQGWPVQVAQTLLDRAGGDPNIALQLLEPLQRASLLV